ncbi:peptide chain release factor 1 [Falsiroseomonas sp. CW058]|uniref:peptide chain release factor 1 n=1 Tax=Falsiroseomonas sp. CW058 TaxID=3388664 RepID=UPI003D31FE5B
MTEREIETKLAEVDRLLNDPETRMDPHRVWSLLAELASASAPQPAPVPARS